MTKSDGIPSGRAGPNFGASGRGWLGELLKDLNSGLKLIGLRLKLRDLIDDFLVEPGRR